VVPGLPADTFSVQDHPARPWQLGYVVSLTRMSLRQDAVSKQQTACQKAGFAPSGKAVQGCDESGERKAE